MKSLLLICALLLATTSCSPNQVDVHDIVSEYYEVYKHRNDFDALLNFYDEDVIVEDMITGEKLVGKKAFAAFFNWENPAFQLLDSVALVIEEQIIDKNKAVIKGYFTPFSWNNTSFEAMQFTTILTINKAGKIIKHVDWINYPSTLVDFETRKNSNEWISE